MFEVADISALQNHVQHWKAQQQRLVLVPTMGNLHQGHLQLVQHGQTCGDKVIVSIFVNPMQFSPGTDFESYPRTLKEDAKKLEALGVDGLFAPATEDIYPLALEKTTQVVVPELSDILCGEHRPGHFVGVTTIVAKLFNIVQPDIAVFGEKDYQQLVIIKKMVDDLGYPVEIQSSATVREDDGLAMSSRNQYLSDQQRSIAPRLYQLLCAAKEQVHSKMPFSDIEAGAMQSLTQAGFKPEYFSIRCANSLAPASAEPSGNKKALVILAAAWLGKARLIDNISV